MFLGMGRGPTVLDVVLGKGAVLVLVKWFLMAGKKASLVDTFPMLYGAQ